MENANVALQKRFVESVLSGNFAALGKMVHPDFVLEHASTVPDAGTYHGLNGFLKFLEIFMATCELERLEQTDLFVSDSGAVIGELEIRGALKSGGGVVDTTMLEKWEFMDGRVVRIRRHYFDPAPR